MLQIDCQFLITRIILTIAVVSCTVPNPNYRGHIDASVGDFACTANQPLRCDGANLIRCGAVDDTAVSETCAFGCSASELRCLDMAPSNGLASFLDQASGEPDLDLGDWATIDTDTGIITLGGALLNPAPQTAVQVQAGAPAIRVLTARSLKAKQVDVVGTNALAVVTSGDIAIQGAFTASANVVTSAAGSQSGDICKGQNGNYNNALRFRGGSGGGGFGSTGGAGGGRAGSGTSTTSVTQPGSAGGAATGTPTLIPLRGGCDGGGTNAGRGGGAIALVSRTRIVVTGTIAVNGGGGGGDSAGGGSGGGILLEAPIVDVSGKVVANGGGGSGCGVATNGQPSSIPAAGSLGCTNFYTNGAGGNGAAGNVSAGDGTPSADVGGGGGGGVGRIRVNTTPDGQHATGLYSPAPTYGPLAGR